MAHRELREDEHCCKNTFLGVHVYEFTTVQEKDGQVRRTVLKVECRLCHEVPKQAKRRKLLTDYELAQARNAEAVRLHNLQKQATGTQLTRRAL
jgi:hypothetical protein